MRRLEPEEGQDRVPQERDEELYAGGGGCPKLSAFI